MQSQPRYRLRHTAVEAPFNLLLQDSITHSNYIHALRPPIFARHVLISDGRILSKLLVIILTAAGFSSLKPKKINLRFTRLQLEFQIYFQNQQFLIKNTKI